MLTYDPKKNIVIFGVQQLTGMAEDDMITIKPLGDGAKQYVGADGEVARSLDPNMTYEVSVSLSTASKSNEYLSNLYNKDRSTGDCVLPLLVKDMGGSTLFSGKAYIANFPESKRGRTISSQTWVFNTDQITSPIVGGNE